METWDAFCPGCFRDKGETAVCPYCGYDESERRTPLVLPYRTVLNGQFIVGKVLGKPGGFGITYLGWDINLATLVAVKEYLPRDYAGRDSDHATVMAHSREDANLFRFGLEQFLQEARTLAQFDHPNVVRVRSFFEQHGTAYLVMDYLQGVNLSEYMIAQGGHLREQQAAEIMMPIVGGLQEVHAKGFLHRDIKPQNIYVTTSGRPILLDFGAARQAMGERSRSLSVLLTPGFSPYEQYHRRGEQGPWTDIYALAATYYYVLAGQAPPDAPERVAIDELIPLATLVPGISPSVNSAIMQALALESSERPQDVFVFRDMINGKIAAVSRHTAAAAPLTPPPLPPASVISVTPPPLAPSKPQLPPIPSAEKVVPHTPNAPLPDGKKSSAGRWLVLVGFVLLVAVAGWFYLGGTDEGKKSSPVATPVKQAEPAASPAKPSSEQPAQPQTNPPFQPLKPEKTVPSPAKPVEVEKSPIEVSPPPSETPTAPKQQPAVRTQPPADKPTTPTSPKRDKGSLW